MADGRRKDKERKAEGRRQRAEGKTRKERQRAEGRGKDKGWLTVDGKREMKGKSNQEKPV